MCLSKAQALIQDRRGGLTTGSFGAGVPAETTMAGVSALLLLYGPVTWPEPMLQHGQKRNCPDSRACAGDDAPTVSAQRTDVEAVGAVSSERYLPTEFVELIEVVDVSGVLTGS
jgi:hypothetical protein